MTEQGVATEATCHLVSPLIGIGIVVRGQLEVHSLGIVHVVEVGHCLNGEKHQLAVEVAGFGRDILIEAQGAGL